MIKTSLVKEPWSKYQQGELKVAELNIYIYIYIELIVLHFNICIDGER